jgi:methylase of polypeptide subunit release factors
VERALRDGAALGDQGFLMPDAAALLVYRACQVARPYPGYHRSDWDHFLGCLPRVVDWDRVWTVPREARVESAVRRALEAAKTGNPQPSGPLFDRGVVGAAWKTATALQGRVRPTSVARLLAASSRLGEITARCRVDGTEVLAGPGVFVPTPDAERFVGLVVEHLSGTQRPIVVEIGTGCGAIGLAIAQTRPDAEVHLADLSRAAVWWTNRNRRLLGLGNVRVYRGSLLQPIGEEVKGRVAVVLANLPFYPAARYAAIGGVPRDTIQGEGEDGLGLLRRLAEDATRFLSPRGRLLLQMFAWQWETFAPELAVLGYHPGEPSVSGPFAICPADLG